MLMNHKNFHLTQFPDKTNDVIFLKSPKTLFLGHFWSFLPIGNFFQKIRLCHIKLYLGSWRHAKFQKKTNQPIPRKPTDRRKDGHTLFYRTLPDETEELSRKLSNSLPKQVLITI